MRRVAPSGKDKMKAPQYRWCPFDTCHCAVRDIARGVDVSAISRTPLVVLEVLMLGPLMFIRELVIDPEMLMGSEPFQGTDRIELDHLMTQAVAIDLASYTNARMDVPSAHEPVDLATRLEVDLNPVMSRHLSDRDPSLAYAARSREHSTA